MLTPIPSLTPSGCRALQVRYPAAMAIRAAQLPPLVHDGVTYVLFTGRIVGRDKDARGVYEAEYRALRVKDEA